MTLPVAPADIVRLGRQHGAVDVRLFGSFARGTADSDSDLDLLVRFQPGRSLLDLVGLKQDLEALASRRVDIVTEAALHPALRERVLSEAVALAP
ncbi:nucleotidyltransferase family protein [Rubrivirga sp. IMCC45206]|uniref:nucleotidyltransferase family protein n=1 Tax=Rubrivirga sp. IMCC45206 TaxID=3391614 RepID=UPI00398FDB7F